MNISRKVLAFTLLGLLPLLISCQRNNTVCPPDNGTAITPLKLADLLESTTVPISNDPPTTVEIDGKMIEVDKLVDYPLCNDEWDGIVYVGCDVQVAIAEFDQEDNPLFFKGCNLNIQPNTIVYVAAHNDAPFYKGCSCHIGENPTP
jgi:hypothetical protein